MKIGEKVKADLQEEIERCKALLDSKGDSEQFPHKFISATISQATNAVMAEDLTQMAISLQQLIAIK